MEELKQRILKEGIVLPGNVLKVDSFLNQQLDIQLIDQIGEELYRRFKDKKVTKVLTLESAGISIACSTARLFGVPVVFARKERINTMAERILTAKVHSFSHETVRTIHVASRFLDEEDIVLIVDDFLANGCAVEGLLEICDYAGCEVAGLGFVIEKAFQRGGELFRQMGLQVESLAVIESMDEEGIKFKD